MIFKFAIRNLIRLPWRTLLYIAVTLGIVLSITVSLSLVNSSVLTEVLPMRGTKAETDPAIKFQPVIPHQFWPISMHPIRSERLLTHGRCGYNSHGTSYE